MSLIYLGDVLRITDPLTGKPALNVSELSEILHKDRNNFAEHWNEARLSKAMQNTVEDNLSRIHDEISLHSYGWRLFFMLRSLRDLEDRARARIKSASASRSAEQIVHAYEIGIQEVFASFILMISKALSSIEKDSGGTLSQDDLTDIYLAGAVLHTALIVWEDAADALAVLGEQPTLDFELVGLDGFVSVVDVAEKSHALYGAARLELRRLGRMNRKLGSSALKEAEKMVDVVKPDGIVLELRAREERKARLAQQDAEIAAVQIASIESHAVDWQHATPAYKAVIGVTEDLQKRLERLASSAPYALRSGVALLDRLQNKLLARNIAYQAVQCNDVETMHRAAKSIAQQTGFEIDAVWREKIMERTPLHEEIHIASRFKDGIPKMFKLQGETK